MADESVCDGCYEQLKRAMGLQLPWYRLIERVSEMVTTPPPALTGEEGACSPSVMRNAVLCDDE